jgi:hypothetical protein
VGLPYYSKMVVLQATIKYWLSITPVLVLSCYLSVPVPVECELEDFKYTEESLQYLNPNMGDSETEDEDDEKEGEDVSPFEKRARTMVDVTPAKDGGVLKKLRRHGSGDVVQENAFVTGKNAGKLAWITQQ